MRGRLLVLLALVLLAGTSLGQPISDPAKTNVILSIQSTPQLAPGQRGEIQLQLHNPYNWTMENVSLFSEVYGFVHRAEFFEIAGMSNAPTLGTDGTPSTLVEVPALPADGRMNATLLVGTSRNTPSGTIFTQGTYLLRFLMEFDYEGGLQAVMVSPGFYTAEEWAYATRDATPTERATYRYVGFANYSFLGRVLGRPSIDGILPDSGFGVKEPLPLWPFQLLAVGSGIAIALSGYYVWRERRRSGKS